MDYIWVGQIESAPGVVLVSWRHLRVMLLHALSSVRVQLMRVRSR